MFKTVSVLNFTDTVLINLALSDIDCDISNIEDNMNTNWEKFTYDVIDGKANGEILFQPRILCWYSDKVYRGESLGEFEGLSLSDIYKKLDICNRIYDYGACIQRTVEDKRIKHSMRQITNQEREFLIETPIGDITMRLYKNNSNGGEFYSKWWVENEEDLKVYTYYEEASDWKFYPEIFQTIRNEWKTMGAPTLFLPRTSIMHAYLDTMGVENTTYALYDMPDLMEKYFKALHNSHDRYINVLNGIKEMRLVNFGDNLHCRLLPDRYFEEYILPEYHYRVDKLHKANKFVYSHWDGDTKSILKYAKQTKLDGIEAITPKPQGDVTIEEIKDALGDNMFLIDGIAAILFAEPYSEEQLFEQVEQLIKTFKDKLILGISDEMSSFGDMERLKKVKKIVDDYNLNK